MAEPSADDAKREAGRHAARYVTNGMRVGLGSGTTVHHTIVALGEADLGLTCVATSEATARLAAQVGLAVVAPDDVGSVEVAIDGADEVDAQLNLTKGGGGAHTRERIVAAMAARFVVVVDDSKLVTRLGASGTPLEVLGFAPGAVAEAVRAAGATAVTRRAQPSDSGNVLMDAAFGAIDDPVELGATLSAIPGIVDHGLFPASMVERVVVAGADGVRELTA